MLSVSDLRKIMLAQIKLPCIVYGDEATTRRALRTVPHVELSMMDVEKAGLAPISLLTGFDGFVDSIHASLPDKDLLEPHEEEPEMIRLRILIQVLMPIIERQRLIVIPRAANCKPLPAQLSGRFLHLNVETTLIDVKPLSVRQSVAE